MVLKNNNVPSRWFYTAIGVVLGMLAPEAVEAICAAPRIGGLL